MISVKKLTVQKVAQEVGVSTATVSRVMRNLPGVSPKTDARVRSYLASKEEFRPRVLQKRKMTRIALIAYKSESDIDYFTAMLLSGMSRFAFDYGVDVSLLIRPPELSDVPGLVGMLREHQADAAVLTYPPDGENFLEELKAYQNQIGIPLTLALQQCDFLPSVTVDFSKGENDVARHLIKLGHRRIGYLGFSYNDVFKGCCLERLKSLQEACTEAGFELDESWISVSSAKRHDLRLYYEKAKSLLQKSPELTAIFCYNDDIALSAIRAAKDLKLRVPEDISIAGFDGAPFSEFCDPVLTTYRLSAENVGHESIRVCYLMSKGIHQPPEATVLSGEFIEGASTGVPVLGEIGTSKNHTHKNENR